MANEIKINGWASGATVVAAIERADGQVWRTDTSVFEAYNGANQDAYRGIATTERGTTGDYRGTFPGAIAAGLYFIRAFQRTGSAGSYTYTYIGSDRFEWDGSVEVALSSRLAGSAYSAPPSADTIAAAVWDFVLENGRSALSIVRLMYAAIIGKVTGAGTTTVRFRDDADTKDRIVASVDSNGNRITVTKDDS